ESHCPRAEPACQAAYDGDVDRLYELLKLNPDWLNVREEPSGDTPLIAACRRGNLRTVRYLLDNHANPQLTNQKQRTCLHYVSRRSLSLFDYLMISILMPILLLGYFLMLQKQRQHIALMEVVLSTNVDVNAIDNKGNTALHYVCLRRNSVLVPLLLKENVDVYLKNSVCSQSITF
uniref:Ankyrin repeat domain 22 n=1 Tax=Gouania willdenowi TaxID=441366 RepID=A0A8C5EYI2_GOUWI